jgi:hypothetical protein
MGYASTEYGFDESGQLRLCLKGFGHQTVTVAAPEGVEVTSAQTSSGPSTNVVLRLVESIRVVYDEVTGPGVDVGAVTA